MAGEKEVKAQVRLRFFNVKRERMTATRNLQVTVKKGGGLTMKTLEGLLAKVDLNGDSSDKVRRPAAGRGITNPGCVRNGPR
jgi:DNA repair protein RAD50